MGEKISPRIAGKTVRQEGFTLPELITVIVTVAIVVMHAYDLLPNMKGMFYRFSAIKAAEAAPKVTLKRYDEGHFDIYVGDAFEAVIADQVDFLDQIVPLD